MTFKADWEKTQQSYHLSSNIIEAMIALGCPNKKLLSYQIIAGGCANLNIKISFKEGKQPLILRVYIREKAAAYLEQELSQLLRGAVPIASTYYIGDYEDYRFAIIEFLPGITLRDYLLADKDKDIGSIMYQVGECLAKISAYKIDKEIINLSYLEYAKEALKNENINLLLNSKTITKIYSCLEKYAHLFPQNNEKNLVHADFDPANILVNKVGNNWQVSGILDWEFSHSGSVLCDVANMLRYKNQMPPIFEQAFLRGLNIRLLEHWQITVDLLNLVSLLDMLIRSSPKEKPKQYTDLCSLITHIIKRLEK